MDTKLWFEEVEYILSLFDVFLNFTLKNFEGGFAKRKIEDRWLQLRNYLAQRVLNKKEIYKFVQEITSEDISGKVSQITSMNEYEEVFYRPMKLTKEESKESFLIGKERLNSLEHTSRINFNSQSEIPSFRENRQRFQSTVINEEFERPFEKELEWEKSPKKFGHRRNFSQPLSMNSTKMNVNNYEALPINQNSLERFSRRQNEIPKHILMLNEMAKSPSDTKNGKLFMDIVETAKTLSKSLKSNREILKSQLKLIPEQNFPKKKTRLQKFEEEKKNSLEQEITKKLNFQENKSQNNSNNNSSNGNFQYQNTNYYGSNIVYHPQFVINPQFQISYGQKRYF